MDSCDKGCAVLIVDTAPEKVRQLMATLRKEYTVTVATCGQQGSENGLNVPGDAVRFTVMMPEPGADGRSGLLKAAPMPHATTSAGISAEQQQAVARIRHELANANHGMLLGLQLLSRYWEDLTSYIDESDNGFDGGETYPDNYLVARKHGATVIAGMVESARKMEMLLTRFKERGHVVATPAGEE